MKITKRRWGTLPEIYVHAYRCEDKGMLFEVNQPDVDYTAEMFKNELVKETFDKSLQGRLLRMDSRGNISNADVDIRNAVIDLCTKDIFPIAIGKMLRGALSAENAQRQIEKTMTEFGVHYPGKEGIIPLGNAISILLTTTVETERARAMNALREIHKMLQRERHNRMKRVCAAIEGNKIPLKFDVDENGRKTEKIVGASVRTQWLLDLLDVNGDTKQYCYPILSKMETIMDYDTLSTMLLHAYNPYPEKFDSLANGLSDIQRKLAGPTTRDIERHLKQQLKQIQKKKQDMIRELSETIYEVVQNHYRTVWGSYVTPLQGDEEKKDELKSRTCNARFYFQALKDYFQQCFPIRAKTDGARKRQEHLEKQQDVLRLLKSDHISRTVQRDLINQSTQIHILYGKIMEYCMGDNALPLNSNTLQQLQVIEAVKKQMMTALLWAVARLNYFCEHVDDEMDSRNGDILLNTEIIKSYLKAEDGSDRNANTEKCWSKMQLFFSLKFSEPEPNECFELMETLRRIIYRVRVNIFHFKSARLTQALVQDQHKDDFAISNDQQAFLQTLYDKDRNSIQTVMQQQILSMNLPLYYTASLLDAIFSRTQGAFKLYSDNEQMTPSFRQVYKRGNHLASNEKEQINLQNASHPENGVMLRWFLQPEKASEDAIRTLHNLLQMIYEHFFLPAMQKRPDLLTCEIRNVIERDKKIAKEAMLASKPENPAKPQSLMRARMENAIEKNGGFLQAKNDLAYAYAEMDKFYSDGMPLKELMKKAQSDISRAEQDELERVKKDRATDESQKKDYTQRFLRDVYAYAFNRYLDQYFANEYIDIMRPEKSTQTAVFALPDLGSDLPKDKKLPDVLLTCYPIFRLLDGPELSALQHQMLRYRVYLDEERDNAIQRCDELFVIKVQEDLTVINQLEELLELVKLTEPLQAEVQNRNEKILEMISPFVEGDPAKDYGDFYTQSDSTTLVPRRNILRMERTGVLGIYELMMPKQGTRESYDKVVRGGKWYIRIDGQDRPIIEVCQQQAKQLHEDYEKNHKLKSDRDYLDYKILVNYINDYNDAMRAMSFASLYEISRIHMEILSRWVGFTQDWERDMNFLLKAWAKQGKICERVTCIEQIFHEGNVRKMLLETLNTKSMNAFLSIYRAGADRQLKYVYVRNRIEHLALLRKDGWNGKNVKKDMGVVDDCLNRLRQLLYYDTKRMNAVTKAMQKIMEQHKLRISFTMQANGEVRVDKVEPLEIVHLKERKEEAIRIKSHSETFVNALTKLMKYHP